MTTSTVEFTKEEIAQRGQEIYERDIKPVVESGNIGRVLALDVRSREYVLTDSAITSVQQLRLRAPEALIFVLRIGYPGLHRIL